MTPTQNHTAFTILPHGTRTGSTPGERARVDADHSERSFAADLRRTEKKRSESRESDDPSPRAEDEPQFTPTEPAPVESTTEVAAVPPQAPPQVQDFQPLTIRGYNEKLLLAGGERAGEGAPEQSLDSAATQAGSDGEDMAIRSRPANESRDPPPKPPVRREDAETETESSESSTPAHARYEADTESRDTPDAAPPAEAPRAPSFTPTTPAGVLPAFMLAGFTRVENGSKADIAPPVRGVAPIGSRSAAALEATDQGADAPPSDAPDQRLAAQISRGFEQALAQRGGSVRVRLHPESLGDVRIELDLDAHGDPIAARILAANAEARELLESSLPDLRSALHGRGLRIDSLLIEGLVAPAESGTPGAGVAPDGRDVPQDAGHSGHGTGGNPPRGLVDDRGWGGESEEWERGGAGSRMQETWVTHSEESDPHENVPTSPRREGYVVRTHADPGRAVSMIDALA